MITPNCEWSNKCHFLHSMLYFLVSNLVLLLVNIPFEVSHFMYIYTQVSRKLGQLYSEMIFVQGYIHCDPHPGNVLVHDTSHGTEIILLDHGLYLVRNIIHLIGF